jgi:hypothetical protein
VLALGAVVAAVLWTQPVVWKPDGYFYRVQVLRLRGATAEEAQRQVFAGPLTAAARAQEAGLLPYQRKLSNPEWVRESAQFYERRKLVPLLAVPLDPWLGARGLQAVSLAGYVLLGVALYALLRVWFPTRLALPVAALALLLGPVREWSSSPLTDSWGLALATAALVAGCRVLSGHGRWLVAWAALVLALGFTRDLTLMVVGAAALAAIALRTRTSLALVLTGVVAALPAPALYGAPLKAAIAYPLVGYYPVSDPSWSFIADRYVDGVQALVKSDLGYLTDHPETGLVLVCGTLAVALLPAHPARALLWGTVPAAAAYLLLAPNYTELRLELVFLPAAALGVAAATDRLEEVRAQRTLRVG